MRERKNIDRLFQENFRDFEVTPDEKVWQNIEAELKEKKKRRIIPFWWKLSGVAALLLIGLFLFSKFTGNGQAPEHKVAVGDQKQQSGNESGQKNINPENHPDATNPANPYPVINNSQEAVTDNGQKDGNASVSPEKQKSAAVVSNESGPASEKENVHRNKTNRQPASEKNNVLRHYNAENAIAHSSHGRKDKRAKTEGDMTVKNAVALNSASEKKSIATDRNTSTTNADNGKNNNQNPLQEVKSPAINGNDQAKQQATTISIANAGTKKDSAAIATAAPNALEELLNEKENKVTAKEQKVNRWQITSNVAPIYFSSTSNGSPLDSRFEGNKKSYTPSTSYGVGAKYAISKKFSIKSGVNTVALEYNTSDLVFFQTENARRIENVTPNIQGSMIQVDNKPDGPTLSSFGRTRTQFEGNVNQKIGYVEVPVEMSYKLLDRKLGVELIGGLSTMILNNNEVSIQSSGVEMNIGQANNLNTLHFSTNVGVGFKYNFLKSFQANFEPMLKYQINTFSNDPGNFKPYFLGLYTGVSYRF